jgi:hypothetical protein
MKNINGQLERKELKVETKDGGIVDSTVIESAAGPEKVLESVSEDQDEENQKYVVENVSYSKDKDAWLFKKGGKSYFGSKVFPTVDAKADYIEKIMIKPLLYSDF